MLNLARLESSGIVAQIEFHAEIGSTNDRASQLAGAELQLPLLVIADRQTAGRGRGANRWWSAPGALTFSLLVESAAASVQPTQWPQLSLTAGLAVCEALQALLPQQLWGVKWPNDVYLGGPTGLQKVCGILIESPSARRGRLIIGIGINVNNSFAAAPEELRERATALCDVAGRSFDRTDVLLQVIHSLHRRWGMLGILGFGALADDWRRYCILQGQTVTLEQGGERVVGLCQSIDDDGALVLQTPTERRRCIAGTIVQFE